jgi:hypothetical protein
MSWSTTIATGFCRPFFGPSSEKIGKGAGMSWIPELIAGLRDISIIGFLGYGLTLMKQQNDLLNEREGPKAVRD